MLDLDVEVFKTSNLRHIFRCFASSALFECPPHEQRIVPVLFETFAPITGQRDPSIGSGVSGIGVGVAVGEGVGVGAGSTGLNTGFTSGFVAALTVTPLFQTSFVPDLTQVYFFPADTDVAPALVHLAPALTAAFEGALIRERERITDSNTSNFLRMKQLWRNLARNSMRAWSNYGMTNPPSTGTVIPVT